MTRDKNGPPAVHKVDNAVYVYVKKVGLPGSKTGYRVTVRRSGKGTMCRQMVMACFKDVVVFVKGVKHTASLCGFKLKVSPKFIEGKRVNPT